MEANFRVNMNLNSNVADGDVVRAERVADTPLPTGVGPLRPPGLSGGVLRRDPVDPDALAIVATA